MSTHHCHGEVIHLTVCSCVRLQPRPRDINGSTYKRRMLSHENTAWLTRVDADGDGLFSLFLAIQQWNESPCSQSSSQSGCSITELLVPPFAISEQAPCPVMKKGSALCGSMEMSSHPHIWCSCIENGRSFANSLYTDWKLKGFLSNNLDFVFQLCYLSHRGFCFSLQPLPFYMDIHLHITSTYKTQSVRGTEKVFMALRFAWLQLCHNHIGSHA